MSRVLKMRRGAEVRFPAYLPVTTFGEKYPLDRLVRPYLPRLAQAAMVSLPYARQIGDVDEEAPLPLWVDSGGFASLLKEARVVAEGGLGVLSLARGEETTERVHPRDVLEVQERVADVAFPLDFPIPPGMDRAEGRRRQRLTVANARWALANRRRADLPLYGVVQGWDVASYRACARELAGDGFDGIAIGGLVPRARDLDNVLAIVGAVREEVGAGAPLHVLGLGSPDTVERLFAAGVDSVDSSAYLKMAADGRLWSAPDAAPIPDPTPASRLGIALSNLASAAQVTLPLSTLRTLTGLGCPVR
jgi:helicase